jgi:magnesium transporter
LIRKFAVTAHYNIVKDIPLEELSDSKFLWYWVDFNCPIEEEAKFLESHFHFHPLAIEDCLHFLQRPKLGLLPWI